MKFDFHYMLSDKYSKWIIFSLIPLFVILILIELAFLFISPIDLSRLVSNNTLQIKENRQESYQDLLNSSLFGVYVPTDLDESQVKKSMLNVTLVGILFAQKLNDSQVIIRSASGEEKTYKIGDSLPGGVIVKRIMADGILVERDGTLESLSLPRDQLQFESIPKPLKEE